jgi:pyrimidine-nucleoside phosphorylase
VIGVLDSSLIEKKRRGHALSPGEVEEFFGGFLAGTIPDYQMSAFLMAVHLTGMSREAPDLRRGA